MQILNVNTILCQVEDMDRAVAFYRDTLGLQPGNVSPYWSDFQLGGITIGLHPPMRGSSPPYAVPLKGWILGVQTDDLAELRARLTATGAVINGDYHDVPGGVVLDFADPDGNAIEAIQTGATAAGLAASVQP